MAQRRPQLTNEQIVENLSKRKIGARTTVRIEKKGRPVTIATVEVLSFRVSKPTNPKKDRLDVILVNVKILAIGEVKGKGTPFEVEEGVLLHYGAIFNKI